MASAPPFVPRALQKGAKPKPKPQHIPAYVAPVAGPSTLPAPAGDKDGWADDDIVLLYEMCLSDHAIWSDTVLHNAMKTNDGWVSLRLLDSTLASTKRPEDAQVAKALRACSERVDVRMLISQPDRNNWFGRGDKHESGGYEVRRKDWPLSSLGTYTRDGWKARTVYVENLPNDARSQLAVARLVRTLLPLSASPSSPWIQSVSFPAHFQAKEGEISRCKGFAFVVFDAPELASRFVSAWPWRRLDSQTLPSDPAAAQHISGLRCMSHAQWETLKDEYLAHQAALVQAVATRSTAAAGSSSSSRFPPPERSSAPVSGPAPRKRGEVERDEDEDGTGTFPRNRLVLLRGIPLEATKTSLRILLSQALGGDDGIDYIDFVKNVDRCHVRLSTADHARRLVEHFEGRKDDGVRAALVQGEQEAFYWDKVPEKLRRAAMGLPSAAEPVDTKRPRKRQKHAK